MKKVNVFLIFIAIASIGCLAFVALQLGLVKLPEKNTQKGPSSQDIYKQEYEEAPGTNKELNPQIVEGLFTYTNAEQIYTYEFQKSVRNSIELLIEAGNYNEDNPLVILNPFCTNTQVLYVYFKTEKPCAVSYIIHTSAVSSSAPDFGGYVYPSTEQVTRSNGSTAIVPNSVVHEFGISGLVPGEENYITIKLTDEEGNIRTRSFYYYFRGVVAQGEEQLQVAAGRRLDKNEETGEVKYINASDRTLSDGMFAVFPRPNDFAPYLKLYDNDGYMRGEIPLEDYYSDKLYSKNGELYIFVSDKKLVRMNNFGEVTKIYRSGDYTFGKDWCIDDKGNMLMTASLNSRPYENDVIITIDFTDDDIYTLVDMEQLFSSYFEKTEDYDWIGLYDICYQGDNMISVSSEKFCSIIKIRRIYNDPRIVYIAGDPGVLLNTEYSKLYLRNEGNFAFSSNATVSGYEEYDKIREARHYLWVLDENKNYKYGKKEEHFGYFVRYLVDEEEKSLRVALAVKMPEVTEYSRFEKCGDHWLFINGDDSVFYEYDEFFNVIASFTYKKAEAEKTVEQQDYEEDNPPPDDSVAYRGITKFDVFDYFFVTEPVVYINGNE